MEIKIAKFNLYPREKPLGYAVGFDISFNNHTKSFYRDTTVSFEESKEGSSEDIVLLAWNKIKDSIVSQSLVEIQKEPLLGKRWDPPKEDLPKEIEDILKRVEDEEASKEDDENPSEGKNDEKDLIGKN